MLINVMYNEDENFTISNLIIATLIDLIRDLSYYPPQQIITLVRLG